MTDPGLPPLFIEEHYTVPATQSIAGLVVCRDIPGYKFYKMIRKDDNVTVTFKRRL